MAVGDRLCRRAFLILNILIATLFVIGGSQVHPAAAADQSETTTNVVESSTHQQVQVDGRLEILVEDYPSFTRTRYFLRTSHGRLRLHFAKRPPSDLQTGSYVRATGIRKGSTLTLTSAVKSTQTPSSLASVTPLPNTLGAQSTLVMLVNFQDAPSNQPYTVANAQSVVFNSSSAFFLENSYQQTWLTGDVVGWFTIPVSSTSCDTSSIASYAKAAASAAGINLAAYTHYLYAFPQNNACGWGGLSNIGGSPSQSWINGSGMETHTVSHELGHALGLWHSHRLDCGTRSTIGSSCTTAEYGDLLDTMGVPQTASPHYNSFQK
ncbi:MAG: Peptidase gametolysin [Candidatus Binatus sp.]|nr:Peptidase gametolysin [Candidatus Binatus sp.]